VNEIDMIQKKISGLLDARDYLLNQTPSDMVALSDVTEQLVALNRRQSALTGQLGLPPLSPQQVQDLQSATQTLDNAIKQSKAATDILVAATALAKVA